MAGYISARDFGTSGLMEQIHAADPSIEKLRVLIPRAIQNLISHTIMEHYSQARTYGEVIGQALQAVKRANGAELASGFEMHEHKYSDAMGRLEAALASSPTL